MIYCVTLRHEVDKRPGSSKNISQTATKEIIAWVQAVTRLTRWLVVLILVLVLVLMLVLMLMLPSVVAADADVADVAAAAQLVLLMIY